MSLQASILGNALASFLTDEDRQMILRYYQEEEVGERALGEAVTLLACLRMTGKTGTACLWQDDWLDDPNCLVLLYQEEGLDMEIDIYADGVVIREGEE